MYANMSALQVASKPEGGAPNCRGRFTDVARRRSTVACINWGDDGASDSPVVSDVSTRLNFFRPAVSAAEHGRP